MRDTEAVWARLTAEEAEDIRNEVRREFFREAVKYLRRDGTHGTATALAPDGVDSADFYLVDNVRDDLRMLAFGPKHPALLAWRETDDGTWNWHTTCPVPWPHRRGRGFFMSTNPGSPWPP